MKQEENLSMGGTYWDLVALGQIDSPSESEGCAVILYHNQVHHSIGREMKNGLDMLTNAVFKKGCYEPHFRPKFRMAFCVSGFRSGFNTVKLAFRGNHFGTGAFAT